MITTAPATHRSYRRLAHGMAAVVLLVAALATAIGSGAGYWQLAAFGLGLDLALFLGIGRDLERGRLHFRAVRLYNLLHRFCCRSPWASPPPPDRSRPATSSPP